MIMILCIVLYLCAYCECKCNKKKESAITMKSFHLIINFEYLSVQAERGQELYRYVSTIILSSCFTPYMLNMYFISFPDHRCSYFTLMLMSEILGLGFIIYTEEATSPEGYYKGSQ